MMAVHCVIIQAFILTPIAGCNMQWCAFLVARVVSSLQNDSAQQEH